MERVWVRVSICMKYMGLFVLLLIISVGIDISWRALHNKKKRLCTQNSGLHYMCVLCSRKTDGKCSIFLSLINNSLFKKWSSLRWLLDIYKYFFKFLVYIQYVCVDVLISNRTYGYNLNIEHQTRKKTKFRNIIRSK